MFKQGMVLISWVSKYIDTHTRYSSMGANLIKYLCSVYFLNYLFKKTCNWSARPKLTGNYRPISLLSVFYKLASCAITQRIKPAVESIVGKQQKAYINKNSIGSCIVNLVNKMHHVNKAKKIALILLIDFKKAFDSIDHSFMETVLKTLGFGK